MKNDGFANIEIERKYVIKMPSPEELSTLSNYTRSEIVQIYLASAKGITHRVRRREKNGTVTYTETKKIRIDNLSATEIEREIEKDEFDSLCENIRDGSSPLFKTRHTFLYFGQLFEIDVYPQWTRTAILETELPTRESLVEFPDIIEIVKEVTGEREYSNSAMSMRFPEELI